MKVLVETPRPPPPAPGTARSFADLLLPKRQHTALAKQPREGARPEVARPDAAKPDAAKPENRTAVRLDAVEGAATPGLAGRVEQLPLRPLEAPETPSAPFPLDTLPGRPACLPEPDPEQLDLEEHLKSALYAELEGEGEPTCVEPGPDTEPTVVEDLDAAVAATYAADAPPEPAAPASTAGPRAEAIAALVARIETCLREGQPCLKLGLSDRLGVASVEITRTGRGEVSVRIRSRPGRRGAVSSASAEIAQALHGRGLKLKDLEIA